MKNLKEKDVERIIYKIKKAVDCEYKKKDYNNVLKLVSTAANILYETNIRYYDEYLESILDQVSRKVELNLIEGKKLDEGTLIFWDGFGLNERGLIQIYLLALCKIKKVVYITYSDRKDKIPDVLRILAEYDSIAMFVDRNRECPFFTIDQINSIIEEKKPAHFFFYSLPDDIVATLLMYTYEGVIKRYQINLTDHAFWLGAGCCDICINFREYGANISKEFRGIQESQNVIIPFYPIIDYEKEFQGFPFVLGKGQKIMFSGGSLYKTLGENNRFYLMVSEILTRHPDVIFWYAGEGDDRELLKLKAKYPNRVFHSHERSDLFQLLSHCDIYLSTYPIAGGLMYQYAAMAGLVPVTLVYNNCPNVDGFLINQKNLNCLFDSTEALYLEIDELLSNKDYARRRGTLMRKSVVSSNSFIEMVNELLSGNYTELFLKEYSHVDTNSYKAIYLARFFTSDIAMMAARKSIESVALRYFPLIYIRGRMYRIIKKWRKNICKL